MKFFPAAFNRLARALDVLWGSPSNGQVLTYDSTLQKAKWADGGSGDMQKSTYDANNDGVVDNAAALGGTSAATIISDIAAKLPLAGGTVTGNVILTLGALSSQQATTQGELSGGSLQLDVIAGNQGGIYMDPADGVLKLWGDAGIVLESDLTGINANGITKGGMLAWGNTDFLLIPSGNVGYATYSSGSIVGLCAKSASGTLQSFTWESNILPVPAGFAAFLATGGVVLNYAADTNNVANFRITGITVAGWDGATWANIYTDSTDRTPVSANTVTTVALNISGSPAVPTLLKVSISGQVANGSCGLPLNVIVKGAV